MAIDLDAIRRKHEQLNKPKGGGEDFGEKFIQLADGDNKIRILPGKSDDVQFYTETKIHRLPGEDGKDTNVHCLKPHSEPCPLCDLYYALYKVHNEKVKSNPSLKTEGTEESRLANKIKARERYYMNAIDRKDEKDSKPKIFSVGQKLFQKIVSTMLDPDFGDITDLAAGNDFKIVKQIVSNFPNYDQSQARPKKEPAGSKQEIAAWMESLHNLSELVRKEDAAKVKQLADSIMVGRLAVSPKQSGELSDNEFEARMREG